MNDIAGLVEQVWQRLETASSRDEELAILREALSAPVEGEAGKAIYWLTELKYGGSAVPRDLDKIIATIQRLELECVTAKNYMVELSASLNKAEARCGRYLKLISSVEIILRENSTHGIWANEIRNEIKRIEEM